MTGLERSPSADWPTRDDEDDMILHNAACDLRQMARDKRYISASDRELLEEIQKYAHIILERGAQ